MVSVIQTILVLQSVMLLLSNAKASDEHPFDVLIFTQQWPVTTCIEWKDQGPHHTCLLPSSKDLWTIHGVWPTRLGTIGPSFCNKSAVFDPEQLAPFQDQLQQFWTNIEKGQSLWKHEWLKHGTCASVLPELSNERKYFKNGLTWLQKYSMFPILKRSNILPDTHHSAESIRMAVTDALQKRPFIRCLRDHRSGVNYLSEIRICFSKNLTLVHCDGIRLNLDENESTGTNCQPNEAIIYPSIVPPSRLLAEEKPVEESGWRFPWVDVYHFLKLLQSATL